MKVATRTQTAVRRQEILDSSLRLFLEKGYEQTTIQDIVTASGASIGSIYHHFGEKESIASEVYIKGFSDYHAAAVEALTAATSTEEGIRALVLIHVRWVVKNPDRARLMFLPKTSGVAAASSDRLAPLNRKFFGVLFGWIREHIDRGELRDLSVDLYVSLWVGPSHDYMRRWLNGRAKRPTQAVADELANAAWRALRA